MKFDKKAYDYMWYRANKSYKKTYARLHRRGYHISTKDISEDRTRQVNNRRWIDERTNSIYTGIHF